LENLGEIRLVARIVLGLRSDLDIRRLVDDIERIDLLTNETFLYENRAEREKERERKRDFVELISISHSIGEDDLYIPLLTTVITATDRGLGFICISVPLSCLGIPKNSRYTLLQPHLDVLLFEIIFPLMCFNNDDQVLWDEDPHDVRKVMVYIIEDLYSPRTASLDFVTELVRKRGKDTSPNSYSSSWAYLIGTLKLYGEAPLEQKPYRQKDGALLAVGTLCDKLRQTEPYKSELENMLVQHVFPEFSSPAGHLRAKVLVTAFGCSDPLLIRFC
ncbi:hypothetical protein HID58_067471, partial [Brassica napus]